MRSTSTVDLEHVRADLAEVVDRHDVGLDAPPSRRGRAAARDRAAHRARERRRSRRRRQLRRVRAAGRRRATPAPLARGADRAHAGRRPGRRDRHRRRAADDRDVVRLHRARRHPGPVEPREEGPAVRAWPSGMRLPVVFFTEGGGGRPGDTDGTGVSGLDCLAFNLFARLSGLVPLVGITSGYCFAGNAALLGCCDVIIATEGSNIGMGGPAMIEGGGLGVYEPEGDRPDRRAERQRRHRRARGRRSGGRARREAVPLVLPRARSTSGSAPTSATLRHLDPREPRARLRRAHGRRRALRHRLGARAAPRVRAGHDHRARARRGPAGRHRRQQPVAPRRRDRHAGRRQGRALPAAVRRLRRARALPLRHAGLHGRSRVGGDGRGAAHVAACS